MISKLRNKWSSYKYRFVPWLALNLKDRTSRKVNVNTDKLIPDDEIQKTLLNFFARLLENKKLNYPKTPEEVMQDFCNFAVSRATSNLPTGGTGVFVASGKVLEKSLVALYPGTVYRPMEPVLLQSIGNPFFFRCIDQWHVDGNDRKISRYIYRSCVNRDRIGPYLPADLSWTSKNLKNPMNVGQYVNNQSKSFPSNVAYQECDLFLREIPMELRQFLPNINYSGLCETLRIVALVATRDIAKGEELFSSYFTVVEET